MIPVPNFPANRTQRHQFSGQLRLQKFPPPFQLPSRNSRARLPGKRQPSKKSRPVALHRPIVAFECSRQRCSPLRGSAEHSPVRPSRWLIFVRRRNHSRARQLLNRVVHLRPRNPHPIAPLPAFEFRVGLIPVHRPLSEQAQEHQIRSRKIARLIFLHRDSSVCGSNTTTGTFPQATKGCEPAPPRLGMYRDNKRQRARP